MKSKRSNKCSAGSCKTIPKGVLDMSKISLSPTNAFCPQSLYLYGTYKNEGTPDYGLFCWATYCWDEGLRFVACIGEDKLTRDRIRETGVFSADKSGIIRSEKGAVLEVPVPESSPWTFELEVDKTLHLDDTRTSEIYVCRIRNLRADKRLAEEAGSLEERLALAAPVVSQADRPQTQILGDAEDVFQVLFRVFGA